MFNIATCEVGEDRHIAVVMFRRAHRCEDYARDRIEFDPRKDLTGQRPVRSYVRSQGATKNISTARVSG